MGLGVRPEARRMGVESALVATLLAGAQRRGLERISLSVEQENPAARPYQRAGFVETSASAEAWTMIVEFPPT